MAAIGIDLGTTNSLVAYFEKGEAKIIPTVFGHHLTPSVVGLDEKGDVVVGEIAKERLITHPGQTAAHFKRFMGTNKEFQLGERTFRAEELSSFVLRSLWQDAREILGEEIEGAVISVPAYFNDKQRKATKAAAELAGIRVERLISEPTAAALAHGLPEKEAAQFLVFDLGGGTFDVSVLDYFSGVMQVKAVAGDNFLGGEDFTELIYNAFLEGNKISRMDAKTASILREQAEGCKRELSEQDRAQMFLPEKGYGMEMTAREFEKLATPLLLKCKLIIQRALRDAKVDHNDLDGVVLVGGATRMPLIRSMVAKLFQRLPLANLNPDETVALGAAVQAALKQRDSSIQEMILTDVCPFTLGVGSAVSDEYGAVMGEGFHPIIERNTPIPISIMHSFTTIRDEQSAIRVEVYQGESFRLSENLLLGELKQDIPARPRGEVRVDVRFTYNVNGILEVEVLVADTGEKNTLLIENTPGEYSAEEIARQMEELEKLKVHPREQAQNKLLLARAERLYEESLGQARERVGRLLAKLQTALERQIPSEIVKVADEVEKALDAIQPHSRW